MQQRLCQPSCFLFAKSNSIDARLTLISVEWDKQHHSDTGANSVALGFLRLDAEVQTMFMLALYKACYFLQLWHSTHPRAAGKTTRQPMPRSALPNNKSDDSGGTCSEKHTGFLCSSRAADRGTEALGAQGAKKWHLQLGFWACKI